MAKRHQIRTVGDLLNFEGHIEVERLGPITEHDQNLVLGTQEIMEWCKMTRFDEVKLVQIPGWFWKEYKPVLRWTQPNNEWTKLLWSQEPTYTRLTHWWNATSSDDEWRYRWKLLWGGRCLVLQKVLGFARASSKACWSLVKGEEAIRLRANDEALFIKSQEILESRARQ
ncbi:hypothetical protein R1sor_011483 [Riccia sorocarpa]|uniref:Uncharacterized protein n=1 Tax=Riccia sorocarpa TaxID=122646 RepID=A0ABD3I4Y8_9MARC